ncbi:hypothetical protein EV421DRAFT_1896181 [Armillaria borealis]|uniref:Uncharacterized protein n=1 Tax=Armillaria borealis TaxID=47425 RepID=A0AA39KBU7_9AGAR|nr:hypothetical protein EV421DRAFT_1896181 [Armillaria borealis]
MFPSSPKTPSSHQSKAQDIGEEGFNILATKYTRGPTESLYAESNSGSSVLSQQGLGRLAQDSNGSHSTPPSDDQSLPIIISDEDDNKAFQYYPHSPTLSEYEAYSTNPHINPPMSPKPYEHDILQP